jgi:nucleoside-diphosphate-sugar epimerase
MTGMTTTVPAVEKPGPRQPGARARVAIAGATGYAGQELVRLLARHPGVTVTDAMSSGATRRRCRAAAERPSGD